MVSTSDESNIVYVKARSINDVSTVNAQAVNNVKNIASYNDKSHIYEQQAEDHANTAKHYADVAMQYAENSKEAEIWAEGTDEEVQALGGEHSAKTWAELLAEGTGGKWGNILGDITEQYDLMEQLDSKANTSYVEELVTGFEEALDNKVSSDGLNEIYSALNEFNEALESTQEQKQDKLTAGENITISNNVVSAKGGDKLYDKITNCILEVPQRIKYTLTDGTLTIKAGSVVIVPYGTEDLTSQYPVGSTFINDNFKVVDTQYFDGKFFVWVELQGDCTGNVENTTKADRLFFIRIDSNVVQGYITTDSGIEDYTGTGNCVLYRTDLNKMKHWNNGTATNNVYCFPLGIVIGDGTNLFGSIKQIFNGFGYIGSYVWKDKGVKALSPNGFNNNGTFANIEVETERLNGRQLTSSTANTFVLLTSQTSSFDYVPASTYERTSNPSSTCRRYYNPIDNFNYNNESGNKQIGYFYAGTCTITDGKITSFDVKQPVRLVDYNDIKDNVYIVETYSNGSSWYRVYSDGWCEQGGQVSITAGNTNTVNLLVNFKDKNYSVFPGGNFTPGSKTVSSFIATPNGVVTNTFDWEAKGYIE